MIVQGTVVGNGINDNATYVEEEPIVNTFKTNGTVDDTDDLTNQFKGLFDAFAQSIPNNSHEAKTSKNFFKKFSDYIGSKSFKDDLEEKSEKYHIPKKQLAKNFFLKILGILGDILGVVINTVCSIVDTAISLLSTLLHGAVSIIAKAGNAIARVVSCNQTCIAY
jgi:hypothetical protein